jgi:hypothetical protein
MGDDFTQSEQQWPSRELLAQLDAVHVADEPARRQAVVNAVFSSIAGLRRVSHYLEGGYLPFAEGPRLHPFFAAPILASLKIAEGDPAQRFGELLVRDLIRHLEDGQTYGPSGAFLFLDRQGDILCELDNGHNRRPRPPRLQAKIA